MKELLVPQAYMLTRLYLSSIRLKVVNKDTLRKHLEKGGKAIGCFWHQRFFGAIGYAKRFSIFSPSVIISNSRDGKIIAQVALRLGFRPIRGSSSRGGKEALAAIVQDLAQNTCVAHAVDEPRGPKGVVKAGLVRMAQLSRATIFQIHISVDRAWIMNSWDRFLIPKPFSRILIRWEDPIFVPEELDSDVFESIRLDIENRLIRGHAKDDLDWGWERPL
jgi:lysophospholipid acyltransferase (LPLAT)-like uncharacterized protein